MRPEKRKKPALGRAEETAGIYLIGALGYKERKLSFINHKELYFLMIRDLRSVDSGVC